MQSSRLPLPLPSPLLLLLALPLAPACASDDGTGDPDPTPSGPTYYADIKPLVDARCAGCHYEGGIAPFPLETYDDVSTHAGVAKLAIDDGLMPPWPPDDQCNQYLGDRSLSADEKALFQQWIDAGTPAGDPADEGAPLPDNSPRMSRVDATLPMAEPYTPTISPDDYRCFLIPWPSKYTTTEYVTGFRAVPGNDKVVHHVIAFLASPDQVQTYRDLDAAEDGPGYTCFGGTGGPAREWLGGWAPGSLGADLPDGVGIAVQPGSMIILQVHYNLIAPDPAPDQTSIELKVDDAVTQVGTVQPWANPQWLSGDSMLIPAGDGDVEHNWQLDPTLLSGGKPLTIHTVGLHMHRLGHTATLSIERADGSSDCLLDIGNWDFNWQGSYALKTPVQLDPGDALRLECHWNNSPENQPIVGGTPQVPRDVTWGEGTSDEMCLGIALITQAP